MSLTGDIYRYLLSFFTDKPSRFGWLIKDKVAASGRPMTHSQIAWVANNGIKSVFTIREALDKLIVAKFEKMGLKDISGEQYIRKIVQVEIQIGKWENTSIGNLIDEISKKLDDNYRLVVKNSKDLIKQVVESNPRQTKRFINNLIIALTANPDLDYNTFLCVEALQKRWRNFYNNLSNTKFLRD